MWNLLSLPWLQLRRFAYAAQRLGSMLRRDYEPAKHYMRGPGPKWHAKHAQSQ